MHFDDDRIAVCTSGIFAEAYVDIHTIKPSSQGTMTDKNQTSAREPTGKPAIDDADATLDRALRELYAQYGEGELPRHLIELANRLEAARNAAAQGAPAGKPGDPCTRDDARQTVSRGAGIVED